MATRAIKPKRDEGMLAGFQSLPERAPSLMREDTPTIARIIAFISLLFVTMGLLAMIVPALKPTWRYFVGPGLGFFLLVIGVGGLLFHAFREKDFQFRVVYRILGMLLLLPILHVAIALLIMPFGKTAPWTPEFMTYGIPALFVALLFLLAGLRHEPIAPIRQGVLMGLGLVGLLLAMTGLIGGSIRQDFLLGEGVLLMLLGLVYMGGFVVMQDPGSPLGFRAGQALGVVGLLTVILALGRSMLPQLLYRWRFRELPPTEDYLVPAGLVLLGLGLLSIVLSFGICSDRPLVVQTRRELSGFFYSPIAYLVLMGWMLISWYAYVTWADLLFGVSSQGRTIPEPIVRYAFFNLVPVIGQMFVVPIVTMRLLSEEKRTGTLEVLLTAPVNEVTVVASKFLAALSFYLLTWVPWFLFLVAFRVVGGEAFDYRPLLSFFFTLFFTGAGIIALGLFFSSITSNQIVAAVFTFVGMILQLAAYITHSRIPQESAWSEVLNYVSMFDLWDDSLGGVLAPRYLFFHLSFALFFLFLTVKVLESRKWR